MLLDILEHSVCQVKHLGRYIGIFIKIERVFRIFYFHLANNISTWALVIVCWSVVRLLRHAIIMKFFKQTDRAGLALTAERKLDTKPQKSKDIVSFFGNARHLICALVWWLHLSVNHNSSLPSAAYMRRWTKPTLVHYLNQCWINVNWTRENKIQRNFNLDSYIFIQGNAFENVV